MFNKLFANCLLVNDFDKSLAFYRDIVGLEVNSAEGKFADFKLKGTSLAIFEKESAVAMFPKEYMGQGGGIILAFQVENVQKICDDLISKGVKIFEGPKTTAWGQTVAYFKDPDNNIWEISAK
ncbi:MAG: Glyoxalase/bleomycin resistance protein/dioxygenase [Parcubacteria group bacterium GW2011_GWF2_38_8]|nr:MAG: Glyoxalase/bleomycin resistance protein/dioxygenase [Parcubacteria group bacterium GW2011_GWF2_38_8]